MAISLTFILYYVYLIIPSLGSNIFDCPPGWITFLNKCYRYVTYPQENFHMSDLTCQVDGATLVKVEDSAENEFIISWIKKYSRSLQWYTDGTVNLNSTSPFVWQSSGKQIKRNFFWIDETEMKREGSSIVYTEKGNTVGWSRSPDTEQHAYICEISRVEAYRIFQKPRDYGYGQLVRNRNEILKGPNITIDATDTIILESSQYVFLECVAEGNPMPVYKWYRLQDNTKEEVTSASDSRYTLTNGKLTITNPVADYDVGRYQCSAENEFGKVLGNIVLLSFAHLGHFSNVIPEPVYADAYDPAIIHCSHISFKPAITYQWVKGDMNFVRTTKQRYMFISRNGQLYFSEVSLADAGVYRCFANLFIKHNRNDVDNIPSQLPSRISNAIQLIVKHKASKVNWGPVIHNDFIAVFPTRPIIGDDIYLECFAQGSSDDSNEIIYSWSKIDGDFSDRVSLSDLNRVLYIKEARWNDEGQYKCTAQRGITAQDERVYFLRFQSKPIMVVPLKPLFVDIDSKVVWHCEAFSQPKPSYTWYKNGIVLRSSEDVNISANILIINVAKKEYHNGMYQCVASNNYGTTFSSAQLSVLAFKPNFFRSKALRNIKGAIGGNITLLCEAEAAPLPSITWKQNGKLITNDLTSRIQQLQNGNLRIQKLNVNDQGKYLCTASNSIGQATLTFHLNVTTALVITAKPQDTEVNVNKTVALRCDASYNPRIDTIHQWYFNDIKIEFDDNPHFQLVIYFNIVMM